MRARILYSGLVASVALVAFSLPAAASSTTAADTYWGGYNTYNNNQAPPNPDVIGGSAYEIYGVTATRNNDSSLTVKIFTNFVNHINEDSAHVGLGDLFLVNGNVTFNTNAPNYAGQSTAGAPSYLYDDPKSDTGRFDYAVNIPNDPGSSSGSGKLLYALNGSDTDVVWSNVNGLPGPTGGGYAWRADQYVEVNTTGKSAEANDVTWSIDGSDTSWGGSSVGSLTFNIANAFGTGNFLQDTFTLAWAMTCANDVVYLTPTLAVGEPVPLPASLPLFLGGAGFVGWLAKKRRKNSAVAAA